LKRILSIFFHNVISHRLEGDLYQSKQITIDELAWILEFLKRRYEPISLETFLDLYLGRRRHRICKTPILIGFDDGHAGAFYNGGPVLEELKVPAVIFTLGKPLIDNQFVPPYIEFFYLIRMASIRQGNFRGKPYNLDRSGGFEVIRKEWALCRAHNYDIFLTNLSRVFRVKRPTLVDLPEDLSYVKPAQLKNYPGMDYLRVASHAMTHIPLTWLTSSQKQRELEESHELLWKICPTYDEAISYPDGAHDEQTRQFAKSIYKIAFAVETDASFQNRYAYPRECISSGDAATIRYAFSLRRRWIIIPIKAMIRNIQLKKGIL